MVVPSGTASAAGTNREAGNSSHTTAVLIKPLFKTSVIIHEIHGPQSKSSNQIISQVQILLFTQSAVRCPQFENQIQTSNPQTSSPFTKMLCKCKKIIQTQKQKVRVTLTLHSSYCYPYCLEGTSNVVQVSVMT